MAEEILAHTQKVQRGLGLDQVDHVDFSDLRGFKIIKIFVSFKSLEDKNRVSNYLKEVRMWTVSTITAS